MYERSPVSGSGHQAESCFEFKDNRNRVDLEYGLSLSKEIMLLSTVFFWLVKSIDPFENRITCLMEEYHWYRISEIASKSS